MKDLSILSQKTSIPLSLLQKALQVPQTCIATTPSHAEHAYKQAPGGSETQRLALEKWNELSLIELEQATELKAVHSVYQSAPPESEAQLRAFEKWNTLSLEKARVCNSREFDWVASHVPRDSKAFGIVMSKWKKWSRKQIDRASNAMEAKEAWESTPNKTEVREIAFKKWTDLALVLAKKASNSREAWGAYYYAPNGSKAQRLAQNKRRKFSLQQIEKASIFEEAELAHRQAPRGVKVQRVSFEKWLILCTTIEEAAEVYKSAFSESEKELVILKMNEIYNSE